MIHINFKPPTTYYFSLYLKWLWKNVGACGNDTWNWTDELAPVGLYNVARWPVGINIQDESDAIMFKLSFNV